MQVQHPAFPTVTEEVSQEQLAEWLAHGWLKVKRPVAKKAAPTRSRARRGQR